MSFHPDRERLFDLLADRALVGLDAHEDAELAQRVADFSDAGSLARELELAAAAVAVAAVAEHGIERMPAALGQRIEAAALSGAPTSAHRSPPAASVPAPLTRTVHMPSRPAQPSGPPALVGSGAAPGHPFAPGAPPSMPGAPPSGQLMPGAPPSGQLAPGAPSSGPSRHVPGAPLGHAPAPPGQVVALRPRTDAGREPPRGQGVALAGWLAAAACLLLAVGAWYFRPRTQIVTVREPAPPIVAPPPGAAPTPAEERASLLARAGTARLEWTNNAEDPASKAASGDVVWNAAEQRGYMRFRGLAKNDKAANVYQLWIFDKSRDDRYPVDGGVFDVDDETGDVVVPIQAKLPVGEIALFAVTVEKPGGVVVSKRERIVVTAKPPT